MLGDTAFKNAMVDEVALPWCGTKSQSDFK
jgi:hypothetical protein